VEELHTVARLFKLHSAGGTLEANLNLIAFKKAFQSFQIPPNLVEPLFRAFDKCAKVG
jgi:hypothetical protein